MNVFYGRAKTYVNYVRIKEKQLGYSNDTHMYLLMDCPCLWLTDIFFMFSAIRVRSECAIDSNPIVYIVLLIFLWIT